MSETSGYNTNLPAARPPGKSAGILWILFGIGIPAALLVCGILPRTRQQRALAAEAQDARSAATVVSVKPRMAGDDSMELPADIQAIEEATISARATGYLSKRLVDIGSRVKQGDLLAEIQSPEVEAQLSQAQSLTLKSRATAEQAASEVNRSRAVVRQANSDISRLEAAAMQAKSDVARAQAALEQAKAGELNAIAHVDTAKHTLEARKADEARARAQSDISEKTLKRWQALARQGAVSQQELDQRSADSTAARAAVSGAVAAVLSANSDVQASEHAVSAARAQTVAAEAALAAARQSETAAAAAVASSRANALAAAASVKSSSALAEANRADVQSNVANVKHFAVLQSFSRVVAPFSGVITARNVDVGALVNAGGTTDQNTAPHSGLFGIARTDVLRVIVNLPQTLSGNVRESQDAEITVQQLPGRKFVGKVFRLAGALDADTRTRQAEIHITNQNGDLLPGMYARVHFETKGAGATVRIPSSALQIGAEGPRVAVISSEHKIHYVVLKLGRDYGTEIEALSGLTGAEELVSSPGDDLHEGDIVKATPMPSPAVKP